MGENANIHYISLKCCDQGQWEWQSDSPPALEWQDVVIIKTTRKPGPKSQWVIWLSSNLSFIKEDGLSSSFFISIKGTAQTESLQSQDVPPPVVRLSRLNSQSVREANSRLLFVPLTVIKVIRLRHCPRAAHNWNTAQAGLSRLSSTPPWLLGAIFSQELSHDILCVDRSQLIIWPNSNCESSTILFPVEECGLGHWVITGWLPADYPDYVFWVITIWSSTPRVLRSSTQSELFWSC